MDELPASAGQNAESEFTASGAEEGNTSEGTQCGIPQTTLNQFMDHFVDIDPEQGQARCSWTVLLQNRQSALHIFVVVHERHIVRSPSQCAIRVCVCH